ncbi:MAG: thermonuclease family protein, partial [Pseudomonadota bacterium]
MLELLFAALLLGVIVWVSVGLARKDDKDHHSAHWPEPAKRSSGHVPRTHSIKPKPTRPAPARPRADMPIVEGPAYVVDGDSLRINKQDIRIYGVDAPELNHPYGQKAKWAMVSLCKGQRVKAKIIEEDDHGRKVAMCYLPDGRDLSE